MNKELKQESLARYLNMISQNSTHFDKCSKKIQDVYRQKALWIIEYLASLDEGEPVECSRCGDPIKVGVCENCLPYPFADKEYSVKTELDSLDVQIEERLKAESQVSKLIAALEKVIYFSENGGEPYAGRDARDAAKSLIKSIK